eukprot:148775-Prorocentrum_minimum.AAC.1
MTDQSDLAPRDRGRGRQRTRPLSRDAKAQVTEDLRDLEDLFSRGSMLEVRAKGNSTESVQYYFPPMRSLPFPPPFTNMESDVCNRTTDPRPGDPQPGPRGSRAQILEVGKPKHKPRGFDVKAFVIF